MKRKYAWMIYERWANARISIENARFGTEDNYVDTVGKNTKQITEHI